MAEWTDRYGDTFEVDPQDDGGSNMVLAITQGTGYCEVDLSRAQVLEVYEALGDHLAGTVLDAEPEVAPGHDSDCAGCLGEREQAPEDLLRGALNAAGIDARADLPDLDLLNRLLDTHQGRRLLDLADLGAARLEDAATYAAERGEPCNTAEPVPPTILEEAQAAVYGDRQADYGHPREDFTRTAIIWTGLLQHKLADGAYIDAEDVPRCMIGVKLARDVNAPKRDNRVDGAGYFLTLDRLETGR